VSRAIEDVQRTLSPCQGRRGESRHRADSPLRALVRTAVHDLYPSIPICRSFTSTAAIETGELERIVSTSGVHDRRDTDGDASSPGPRSQDTGKREVRRRGLETFGDTGPKDNCESWSARRVEQLHRDSQSPRSDLLRDTIHLNDKGGDLMAQLVVFRHFRPTTRCFRGGWAGTVRTYEVRRPREEKTMKSRSPEPLGKGVRGRREAPGSLRLTFRGNRVDVVASPCRENRLGTARI